MENKHLKSVFSGQMVEADSVHDYLATKGIGSLVRNHMQENLNAGWVVAEGDRAAEVYVNQEDYSQAQQYINDIFGDSDGTTIRDTTNPGSPPPSFL